MDSRLQAPNCFRLPQLYKLRLFAASLSTGSPSTASTFSAGSLLTTSGASKAKRKSRNDSRKRRNSKAGRLASSWRPACLQLLSFVSSARRRLVHLNSCNLAACCAQFAPIRLDSSSLAVNFFSRANFTLRTIKNSSGSPTPRTLATTRKRPAINVSIGYE